MSSRAVRCSLVQDRERDAGEIDEIGPVERRPECLGTSVAQELARRRLAAPVGEAALAMLVRADGVEPGSPAGEPGDETGADTLPPPKGEHLRHCRNRRPAR